MNHNIAFFGRYSTGKSALINSILGRKVVFEKVTPTHIPPVKICYGNNFRIKVGSNGTTNVFTTWRSFEEEDPLNGINTSTPIEVTVDHPYLKNGLIIWDTPGNNDLNENYTDAALIFLAEFGNILNKGYYLTDSEKLNNQDLSFLRTLLELKIDVEVLVTKSDRRDHNEVKGLIEIHYHDIFEYLGVYLPVVAISPRKIWDESLSDVFQSRFLDDIRNLFENRIYSSFDEIRDKNIKLQMAASEQIELLQEEINGLKIHEMLEASFEELNTQNSKILISIQEQLDTLHKRMKELIAFEKVLKDQFFTFSSSTSSLFEKNFKDTTNVILKILNKELGQLTKEILNNQNHLKLLAGEWKAINKANLREFDNVFANIFSDISLKIEEQFKLSKDLMKSNHDSMNVIRKFFIISIGIGIILIILTTINLFLI